MTTSGVALLAELEGMAQRNAPKKQVEPVKPISKFLTEEEVQDEFLRANRTTTYNNLQRMLIACNLEVFFKRKED